MSVVEMAVALTPATLEEAVLAPLVEPPELFCLRVAVRRDFSSEAHGLAEPGIARPSDCSRLQERNEICMRCRYDKNVQTGPSDRRRPLVAYFLLVRLVVVD